MRALVRNPAKAASLAGLPTVDIVEGDMLWPHTLGPALDAVDRVLMISNAGPQMLETQCTFIDAAGAAGVERIVKFSGKDSVDGFDSSRFRSVRSHDRSSGTSSDPACAGRCCCPASSCRCTSKRFPTIVAEGEIRLPLGDTTLAPVDIDDIAKVAHAVLTTDGRDNRATP